MVEVGVGHLEHDVVSVRVRATEEVDVFAGNEDAQAVLPTQPQLLNRDEPAAKREDACQLHTVPGGMPLLKYRYHRNLSSAELFARNGERDRARKRLTNTTVFLRQPAKVSVFKTPSITHNFLPANFNSGDIALSCETVVCRVETFQENRAHISL